MLPELILLAGVCAPNIAIPTLEAIIKHESTQNPYSIGVNQKDKILKKQPNNLDSAISIANQLIAENIDFDAGLGQINVRNWAWLGLDSTTVFDPCKNLEATQSVLTDCYSRALKRYSNEQKALRAALSCYNTGNFEKGFKNGYVKKVLAQAGIKVPALAEVDFEYQTKHPPQESKSKSKGVSEFGEKSIKDGFSKKVKDGFQSPPKTDEKIELT